VDCDVIQADGGTRTAAITGGWVALCLAIRRLGRVAGASDDPLRLAVAAVSTGLVGGEPRLDLAYAEDSAAETDFNFVLTDGGRFVEIQGTAETAPFSHEDYQRLVVLAQKGASELFALQKDAVTRARGA
jgi:ribonuclease PH